MRHTQDEKEKKDILLSLVGVAHPAWCHTRLVLGLVQKFSPEWMSRDGSFCSNRGRRYERY